MQDADGQAIAVGYKGMLMFKVERNCLQLLGYDGLRDEQGKIINE